MTNRKRQVKTAGAALARTERPVGEASRQRVRDGLENFVSGLGTQRDKRTHTHYGTPVMLTRVDLENMYRGSWLAKKIVNAPADDMTREWVHFQFDDAKDEKGKSRVEQTQFALEEAEKAFDIKGKFNEGLRWGRLYGGAVMVIGTNDTEDLSKALDVKMLGKGCLRYLHVLDRWRVSPGPLTRDLNSPNFGLPDHYILAESTVQVHHTRIIRFNGQKLPHFPWLQNGMWDDSELQHVIESLKNRDITTQGIASMVFESNVDVVKVADLSEMLSSKDGEAILTKRFMLASMLKSFNQTFILDASEEYEKKSNTFSGLPDVMREFMVDVAGASDIPVTRLFGQAAAGLNATGDNDVRNYYDKIKAEQGTILRPRLDYLYEILTRHALGSKPEDFRYMFNSLWQMDEVTQSQAEKNRADRDKVYVEMGAITEGVVARELRERGTYRSLTNEDVELAEELAEAGHEADLDGGTEADEIDPETGEPVAGIAQPGAKQKQPGKEKEPKAKQPEGE